MDDNEVGNQNEVSEESMVSKDSNQLEVIEILENIVDLRSEVDEGATGTGRDPATAMANATVDLRSIQNAG
eukprot:6056475-Amphidinium_carterae.2